jgi:hypothetical protein
MSSSKLQSCLELCRFIQALLKIRVTRYKVHFLIGLARGPCTTFVRTDGVLLEVRNRKGECCTWSLVATTSRILALKFTASLRLLIRSPSLFVSRPYLNFLSSVVYHPVSTKCTPWFTSIIKLSFIVSCAPPPIVISRQDFF